MGQTKHDLKLLARLYRRQMSEQEFKKRASHKLKLSPSSIKLYTECPRKWFFRYVERLATKDAEHLRLGTFVHAVLEDFHNFLLKDSTADLPSLMTACFKNRIPEFTLEQASKVKAHQMLVLYLNGLKKDGLPNVVANEQKFSIDLGDDLVIRGVADRVDLGEDGTPEILDYKTGRSAYLDEFQLLVYGLPLLERDPNLEKYRGTYIVLKEDKRLTYTFTKTDLDRCVAKIRKIAAEIREDQTWEPRPSFLCKWCDYEDICPATKHKRSTVPDSTWLQD